MVDKYYWSSYRVKRSRDISNVDEGFPQQSFSLRRFEYDLYGPKEKQVRLSVQFHNSSIWFYVANKMMDIVWNDAKSI